ASRRGSGNAPANWAFGAFCPMIMMLLPCCKEISLGLRRVWFLAVWALMCVPAIMIGSRHMLFFAALTPLAAVTAYHVNWKMLFKRARNAQRLLLVAITTVLGGAWLFQYFFRSSFSGAAEAFILRAFIAPGGVAGCYYYAFPELF